MTSFISEQTDVSLICRSHLLSLFTLVEGWRSDSPPPPPPPHITLNSGSRSDDVHNCKYCQNNFFSESLFLLILPFSQQLLNRGQT